MPKPDPANASVIPAETPAPATCAIEISAAVHAELQRRAARHGKDGAAGLLEHLFNPERTEPASMQELIDIATAPRERSFDVGGRKLRLTMRPLSSDETAQLDRITAAVIPPKVNGVPNEDDPAYKRSKAEVRKKMQTAAIELSVPGLKLPPGSLEEKSAWLTKHMPPGLIDDLWAAIFQITADPVENALFT